jgi:uncharacterized membrane protein
MRSHDPSDIPSTAAISGHPIHPMLIPFPIAFLVGALVSDLVYSANRDPFWAQGSLWLTAGGTVTGIVAALFGAIDFFTISRVRVLRAAWVHLIGNAIVMLLALISLLMRANDAVAAVQPWGLVLSLMISLILVVTGWLGGELSYRHKVGVNSKPENS